MNFSNVLQGIKNSLMLTSEEKDLVNSVALEYESWEKTLSVKERYLIRKYTLNSHDDRKPNRFFERLNRAMRGDYTGSDKEKLLRYGHIISKAICRQPLSRQIVCYRGVDDDLLYNVNIGTVFSFDQFISTSLVKFCALNKRFRYVIVIPEGAFGAYIENISAFKGQYEFLLDASCQFKLLAKRERNVYLEVVT